MKKIVRVLVSVLLVCLTSSPVVAQTFECRITATTGPGTGNDCVTATHNCAAPAYQFPVFAAGNRCEDFPSTACPVGSHPCLNTNPNASPGTTTGTSGTGGSSLINLDSLISDIGGNVPQLTTLGAILSTAIPFLYATAGFALFLFLISGGFKYLTSAGDPKKMESAKGTLTTALIGFTIIVVAYSLTKVVGYIFNIDIF